MLKNKKETKTEDKKDLKAEIKKLRCEMDLLPPKLREAGLPVMVLIEGWSASGKGTLIKNLISEIDPRFFYVSHGIPQRESDRRYPFMYPYASALPEKGKLTFYESGWMYEAVHKIVGREISEDTWDKWVRSVNQFERQLRDNGYLLLKIFIDIDKKEQYKHLSALRSDPETAWRATDTDLWQNEMYDCFAENYEKFMKQTSEYEKWHVIKGHSREQANRDVLRLLIDKINTALEKGRYSGKPFDEDFPLVSMPKLSEVDLSPTISDKDYDKELKRLQNKLSIQHNIIYRKKIPVILCYEGWDAAGKGGNIRRVVYPLDPRGFEVQPIASPEPHEKARHYLWRFWTRLQRSGHVTVFDRTWYGRVMVERIEGFCTEKEWKRAYNEINEFERDLTEWGAVVLKFWIHIDPETQLERFTARQNTPEKRWKITEEDWRNRDKWAEYETAVNDMLKKTCTKNAPWYIIESNDKKYARIKTLKIITEAIDKAIKQKI